MKQNKITRLTLAMVMGLVLIGTAFAQSGILTQNADSVAVATQTMQKAQLGQIFKAKAGMTFSIEGEYELKVMSVHNNPVEDIIPGASISLTRTSITQDEAPTQLYLVQGEPQLFKNTLSVMITEMSDDAIVLLVKKESLSTTADGYTIVALNQEFKAKEGEMFLVNNDMKIIVMDINPEDETMSPRKIVAILELQDYNSNPAIMRPVLAPITVRMGLNDQAQYKKYIVIVSAASDDAIALKVISQPTLASSTIVSSTGKALQIQSDGAVPVEIKKIEISPGAASPVIESKDGIINPSSNMLQDGLEIQVRNRGETSQLRIETNQERLETYITENNVQARTREKIVNDNSGLYLELSNGIRAEIKVLPEQASDTAKEVLTQIFGALELKEVGNKAMYEAKARERFRVLGMIPARGDVTVKIDAETGEITDTNKPWFSFMSSHVRN